MAPQAPKVLIIDDHVMLAESLALALRLRGFDEIELVTDLDGEAVMRHVEEFAPDVVLLDLFLGQIGLAVPLIAPIISLGPIVLVLTASDDPVLLGRCLEAGASGVFSKTEPFGSLVPSIVDAFLGRATIHPARRDELLSELADHRRAAADLASAFARLTDREAEVLAAIVGGSTADEIASDQFVAVSTIRSHIKSVLRKLGVNSQLAAVALARRAGWPDNHV